MSGLTTHVLDTARGVPAEGVVIELHRIMFEQRHHILTATTNSDGRTAPLLTSDRMARGIYELTFHAGDYFRGSGAAIPEPPFLDVVTIRFGIADSAAHYHVPLLVSPYGYTTYRGS